MCYGNPDKLLALALEAAPLTPNSRGHTPLMTLIISVPIQVVRLKWSEKRRSRGRSWHTSRRGVKAGYERHSSD